MVYSPSGPGSVSLSGTSSSTNDAVPVRMQLTPFTGRFERRPSSGHEENLMSRPPLPKERAYINVSDPLYTKQAEQPMMVFLNGMVFH